MPIILKKIESRVRVAVKHYWATLNSQAGRQGAESGRLDTGNRNAVTGGKQMDGFCDLLMGVLADNGITKPLIHRHSRLEIPGYFRPTKKWDMLIFHDRVLLAGIEFKSQRGPSFGNNLNNRAEEAIGTANDALVAYRERAFGTQAPRPWFGWLMLLEDCEGSQHSVGVAEPHFPVFPEFKDSSYATRYEILLRKLRLENLFNETALILTKESEAATDGMRSPLRTCQCTDSLQASRDTSPASSLLDMAKQQSLSFAIELPQYTYEYGERATGETHGVVLTKHHIVQLILDLANYTSKNNLAALRLLEPSCGEGAFLVEAVRRLLSSARRHKIPFDGLSDAIRAYEIDEDSVLHTRDAIRGILVESDLDRDTAESLVQAWIRQGDFLLVPMNERFDVVVGNPPYVRIEQLEPQLQAVYRRMYETLFDRADLYVAFIERSLELLSATGVLSFICADRWTMNRYGGPLRSLIAREYGVRVYVDLNQASPFASDVIAYPSIFVFERRKPDQVVVAKLREGSAAECRALTAIIEENDTSTTDGVQVFRYPRWFESDEPWVLGTPEQVSALRNLEDRFAPLEGDGVARVGIGVATGADDVFIISGATTEEVERDRLVPLVMRSDIHGGKIEWAGRFVINTFGPNGGAVDLAAHPKLASYLTKHAAAVRRRHVSQRSNGFWFRTIDRVYPELVAKPKLLIPDIAGSNEVAFDSGGYHPHHNLYFVTSDVWDLEVLGGLLSSKVALFFVWSYAVKMRGGYLRFQAQYLRRIRVPRPESLTASIKKQIRTAFRARDFRKLDSLALQAYDLEALPEFSFVDTRR